MYTRVGSGSMTHLLGGSRTDNRQATGCRKREIMARTWLPMRYNTSVSSSVYRTHKGPFVKRPLIAIVLLLLAVLMAMPALAQDDDSGPSPVLVAQLEQLEAIVIELRGLDALRPVTRLFPSREAVIAFLAETFEAEVTDEDVFIATQFYRAFDFAGADFDLATTYLQIMGDQVAGFYNTDTGEMNVLLTGSGVLGDSLPPLEQVIYAHEFTHALQDQHFDLTLLQEIDEADAQLAALALVEGDATLLMQQFMMTSLTEAGPAALLMLLAQSMSAQASFPPDAPPILEAELSMPYLEGMEFVSALYQQGGWDAVNAAFVDPPQATAQILHPERYLQGIAPGVVEVLPGASVLGEGWELLQEATLGEFYLREYLRTQLDRRAAPRAAAGWYGDRYRLYHHAGDDARAWVLYLVWDSDQDAAAFSDAYQQFAAARMGVDGAAVGFSLCWDGADDALCLLDIIDDGRTYIAYAPTVELAAGMIVAQVDAVR